MVGEAPSRCVQLIGGHTDVHEHPIHLIHPLRPGNLAHLGEIPLDADGLGIPRQPLSGRLHGVRVLVDREKAPCGQPLQDGLRVAAPSHSAVNIQSLRPDGQGFNGFLK